jgi:hypothetical protein
MTLNQVEVLAGQKAAEAEKAAQVPQVLRRKDDDFRSQTSQLIENHPIIIRAEGNDREFQPICLGLAGQGYEQLLGASDD